MICSNCGFDYEGKFCSYCGQQNKDVCSWCGANNQQGKYCFNCGEIMPQKSSRKKAPKRIAIISVSILIFSILCAFLFSGLFGNFNSIIKNPPNETPISIPDKTYQSILDEYTNKLRSATPGLIDEYNAEAAMNTDGIMGLAEIYTQKIEKLAEILVDGTEKMAGLLLTVGSGNYDEYQEWANKLYDVYFEESEKIADVYMKSATQ